MGIAQRVMLVVAAALIITGWFMSTRHVYDNGSDCGTAFAQHEMDNGLTEATLYGAPAGTTADCRGAIRDARGISFGIAATGALIAAAALLGSVNLGSSERRGEGEFLRLNG
jgi:hypothetical protein